MFCPHCGKEVSDAQNFCQHCGARLAEAVIQPPLPETAPPSGGREKTPWEDREARGFFAGLFKTLNESLFRPSQFFKKMPVTGGLTDPMLYGLIVGMAGVMFSYFWRILLHGVIQNTMPWMQSAAGQHMFQGVSLALLAFLSPFLIILWLFISSGILHVCLMMVKGAKHGFESTFRVIAYGGSANIFMAIPFCGGLLWLVWTIVLYVIGLREAHETTGGKAAFAVFLPLIVCCGAGLLFVVFMGVAAVSMSSLVQMQR